VLFGVLWNNVYQGRQFTAVPGSQWQGLRDLFSSSRRTAGRLEKEETYMNPRKVVWYYIAWIHVCLSFLLYPISSNVMSVVLK
jgi:hypothetical protein